MKARGGSVALLALVAGGATFAVVACSDAEGESPAPAPTVTEDAAPPPPATTSTPPVVDAAPPVDVFDAGPPLDVPDALVAALGDKTYVEESCESTTYPGWPHEALKCTYNGGLVVTIANPPPDRVARWIVDASQMIPSLDALHTTDRPNWEKGLVRIAKHTIGQSSRIFPLKGQIYEDGTAYQFERGVTSTCTSGCYCRINSTSRPQWCNYAKDVLGTEPDNAACLSKFGQTSKTLPEEWLAHCMQNHIDSWDSDKNEDYRAQAYAANAGMSATITSSSSAADVLAALAEQYP